MGLSYSLDNLSSESARPIYSTGNRTIGAEAHMLDKKYGFELANQVILSVFR